MVKIKNIKIVDNDVEEYDLYIKPEVEVKNINISFILTPSVATFNNL